MKLSQVLCAFIISCSHVSADQTSLVAKLAEKIQIPAHDAAQFFSEQFVVKKPLGNLSEWSGDYDVEEGDSDWVSSCKLKIRPGLAPYTHEKIWLADGVMKDGPRGEQEIAFKNCLVIPLDEEGSAEIHVGSIGVAHLFLHKNDGRILIWGHGFYRKGKTPPVK